MFSTPFDNLYVNGVILAAATVSPGRANQKPLAGSRAFFLIQGVIFKLLNKK